MWKRTLAFAIVLVTLSAVAYVSVTALLRLGYPHLHVAAEDVPGSAAGMSLYRGTAAMTLTGSPNGANPERVLENGPIFNSEIWDYAATFRVDSPMAMEQGIGLALKSVNTHMALGLYARLDLRAKKISIGNYGHQEFYPAHVDEVGIRDVRQGDTLELTLSQRGPVYVIHYRNRSTGDTAVLTIEDTERSGTPIVQANTRQPAVLVFDGVYSLESVALTDLTPVASDLCIVGDSKVDGSGGGYRLRWASLLDRGHSVVFSGAADTTAEVLAAMPYLRSKHCKRVVLAIGYNDLGFKVPTSTWQGQLHTILAEFAADGTVVYPLLPIPTATNVDQRGMGDYVRLTSQRWIDPAVGFHTGSMLYRDRVHLNAFGNLHVAETVASRLGSGQAGVWMEFANRLFGLG